MPKPAQPLVEDGRQIAPPENPASDWEALFQRLEEIGPAEPEFMEGIDDPPLERKEIF